MTACTASEAANAAPSTDASRTTPVSRAYLRTKQPCAAQFGSKFDKVGRFRRQRPRDLMDARGRTRRSDRRNSAWLRVEPPGSQNTQHSTHDAAISRTTTQIPGHLLAYPRLVRFRKPQHDIARNHQHARRAIATLQGMLVRKSLSQIGHHRVLAETFDGPDGSAIAAASVGDAGACRRAVDLDGAGSAHAMLTADVRAGQHQLAAQQVDELLARLGQHLPRLAVHGERDSDLLQAPPARSTARRNAVSARARRQAPSSGKAVTMRAASATGSFASIDASSITSGGQSNAASTARGAFPGNARKQAVALENSPTFRQNFQCPQRASAGSTGTSTARNSSSAASSVSKMPLTNPADAIRRSPRGPRATAAPPRAGNTATQSAAGSACARLPPIVPRLRTGR